MCANAARYLNGLAGLAAGTGEPTAQPPIFTFIERREAHRSRSGDHVGWSGDNEGFGACAIRQAAMPRINLLAPSGCAFASAVHGFGCAVRRYRILLTHPASMRSLHARASGCAIPPRTAERMGLRDRSRMTSATRAAQARRAGLPAMTPVLPAAGAHARRVNRWQSRLCGHAHLYVMMRRCHLAVATRGS